MAQVSTNQPLKAFLKACEELYWQDLLVRFPRRDDAFKFSQVDDATFYRRVNPEVRKEWTRYSRNFDDSELDPVDVPNERKRIEIRRSKKTERIGRGVGSRTQLSTTLMFFKVFVTKAEIEAKSKEDLAWLFNDARQTYLRLCKQHHPDHGGSSAMMTKINTAWARLRELMRRHGVGAD